MARRRKLKADDVFKLHLPTSAAMSPDARHIIYAVQRTLARENRYASTLYLVPTTGGRPRRLTQGDHNDRAPVWRPDGGALAFVSTRDKKSNIFILPLDGGEARQLTDVEGPVGSLQWSPDGREILFRHRRQPKKDPQEAQRGPTYKHITELRHKLDGDGYFPEDRWHLYVANARSGRIRRLTEGPFDIAGPRFSPDGRTILFTANMDEDRDHHIETDHVYLVRRQGGRVRQITHRQGPKEFVRWAPDGRSILFSGHFGGPGEWIRHRYSVRAVTLRGERYRDLTPTLDDWPGNYVASDTLMALGAGELALYREGDGWRVAFVVNERGACRVYSVPFEGGDLREEFGGNVNVVSVSVCPENGRAAVAASTMMDAGDVYALSLDGSGDSRRLTHLNRTFLNQIHLTEPEEVWFRNGKHCIQGWIVKPPGFREGRKYPMLLEIHGGPMAQYGYVFFNEIHLLAAQGYVVVYTNPRGSSGYGTNWVKSIEGRWGTVDYDDLMAATNAMVRKPYVDGKRLGVLGGSYGGFMTTWIIGHTNRFRAAVTQRQAGNRLIQFGSSDFGWMGHHHMKGFPWESLNTYVKQSPNFYADRIKTPLLIIHSEQDLRCPVAQAYELFTFLKVQGETVELVCFEGESHGLSRGGRPANRLERLNRILDWFKRYL